MSSSLHRWKKEIHHRDKYACAYCAQIFKYADLHLDHIIPKSKGGKDKKENLTTTCVRCNLLKGALEKIQFIDKAMERYRYHLKEANYFRKIIRGSKNG